MLATRWHARHDIRVDDVPEPGAPPPGWVRIRVEACGICGTDIEEYTDGPVMVPVAEPHPLTGGVAPLILGHETVGVVEEVADGVELAPGTRVAVETNVFCGSCYWCRRGDFQLCEQLASLGLMGDGGLAEQMIAPAYTCVPYGAHVSATTAVLSEPLSVAVRAVRRGGVGAGSIVGIVGAGAVGLLTAQVARAAGAELVVVLERHERRRALALAQGADAALDPAQAAEAVLDLTGGIGLDVAFEAAGSAAAVLAAFRLARRGGRVVVMGVSAEQVKIPVLNLVLGEKEIVASLSHTYDADFAEAVRLLDDGRIDTTGVVSDAVQLDRAVDAFDLLVAEPGEHLKVVVVPMG
jgi:(R,R)-butanediol dehydrogenase / meso-butanediol dehydrogenase / diacetyl reductase